MKKYDMRICKCGRIHMVDNDTLNKALDNNKNLLLICGGCGTATLIGADIQSDDEDPEQMAYMMYSGELSSYRDKSISVSDFESTESEKGIEEILYSHGIKVPMNTGQYATDCFDGKFSDRWYPDFYKIQKQNITVKEIMSFIEEYSNDRTTVNMNRFINETPEDILEEISHYAIKGLNWNGTKWANEWNSR